MKLNTPPSRTLEFRSLCTLCARTAVFIHRADLDFRFRTSQVADSTEYLVQSEVSTIRGSSAGSDNITLHKVAREDVRLHILWLRSDTNKAELSSLALTAADAVLVFLHGLQTDAVLQSLFKVARVKNPYSAQVKCWPEHVR